MPVSDFTAVLSAVGIVSIALDHSLLTVVVQCSGSDDTSVGADGGALGIVLGPLGPLWRSVSSAGLSSGELERVAVSVGGVDSLGVASVRSSENSFASALPDLVVAVCQLLSVAFDENLPRGKDSVDCRNSTGLGFDGAGALVGSASEGLLFDAAGSDARPGSPGVELVAAWEWDCSS